MPLNKVLNSINYIFVHTLFAYIYYALQILFRFMHTDKQHYKTITFELKIKGWI